MTPRPLYRWKSFWFGMLVIVFLGWSWARSNERREYVDWVKGTGGTFVEQHQGCVSFKRGYLIILSTGLRTGGNATTFQGRWFPDAVERQPFYGGFSVYLAHWFLILLFLVPWSGSLAWRWCKIKRLSMPGT
jgi:hypothetical protein